MLDKWPRSVRPLQEGESPSHYINLVEGDEILLVFEEGLNVPHLIAYVQEGKDGLYIQIGQNVYPISDGYPPGVVDVWGIDANSYANESSLVSDPDAETAAVRTELADYLHDDHAEWSGMCPPQNLGIAPGAQLLLIRHAEWYVAPVVQTSRGLAVELGRNTIELSRPSLFVKGFYKVFVLQAVQSETRTPASTIGTGWVWDKPSPEQKEKPEYGFGAYLKQVLAGHDFYHSDTGNAHNILLSSGQFPPIPLDDFIADMKGFLVNKHETTHGNHFVFWMRNDRPKVVDLVESMRCFKQFDDKFPAGELDSDLDGCVVSFTVLIDEGKNITQIQMLLRCFNSAKEYA